MYKGKVVHLVNQKGFGFIQCDEFEDNLFFHAKDVKNVPFDTLLKDDEVTFENTKKSEKGLSAINVKKV